MTDFRSQSKLPKLRIYEAAVGTAACYKIIGVCLRRGSTIRSTFHEIKLPLEAVAYL